MSQQTAPDKPRPDTAVADALDRLKRLHPKRIDLSLGRMTRLLAALGDPHLSLPPVIHVAGTNGKGSTVAFLRAFLEAAGHRVHAYTSPHLVRFHERIRVAGDQISDQALVDILERCEAVNGEAPITYFEVTTCAALLAFAETPADVVLLETGLGGRLDATNVVPRPAATAITRISMDHRNFLGDTIDSIAAEKAGILKPGVPCVLGPQGDPAATATITARADAIGAPLSVHGRDWTVRTDEDGFTLTVGGNGRRFPLPALPGGHQVGNAAAAILCLPHLPMDIPDAAVRTGLTRVEWPARLQRLRHGPATAMLPAGWDLWLDGGHNDSAGEVLAQWAADRDRRDGRKLHLIAGMLETKDPVEFFTPLAPWAASVTCVPIPDEPVGLTAEGLAAAVRRAGIAPVSTAADVTAAVVALAKDPEPARVLICGSLYLAGAVLKDHR